MMSYRTGLLPLALSTLAPFGVAAVDYDSDVRPVLQAVCLDCHNDTEEKGHLSYEGLLSERALGARGDLLEDLEFVIDLDEMPPADAERQLTPEERESLLIWTQQSIARLQHARPDDPGEVVMPRLTKAEYSRVLSSIAGKPIDPGQVLPQEATAGSGFTNVGAAHSMPMPLVEKYLGAARKALSYLRVSPVHGFEWHDEPVREAASAAAMRDYLISEWTRLHIMANDALGDAQKTLVKEFGSAAGPYLFAAWQLRAVDAIDDESLTTTAVSLHDAINPAVLHQWWRLLTEEPLDPTSEQRFVAEMQEAWRGLPDPGAMSEQEARARCFAIGSRFADIADRIGYDRPFEQRGPHAHKAWQGARENEPPPIELKFPRKQEDRPRQLFFIVGPAIDEEPGDVALWRHAVAVLDDEKKSREVPLHDLVDGLIAEDGTAIPWGHHPAGRSIEATQVAQPAGTIWRMDLPEHVRELKIQPIADPTAPDPGVMQAWILPEAPAAEDLSYERGRIALGQETKTLRHFEKRKDYANNLFDGQGGLSYGSGPAKAKHVFAQELGVVDPVYLGQEDWPFRPNVERDHRPTPLKPFRHIHTGLVHELDDLQRAQRDRMLVDLPAAAQVPHQDLQAFLVEQGVPEPVEGARAPDDSVNGWDAATRVHYQELVAAVEAVEKDWRTRAEGLIRDFAARAWREDPTDEQLAVLMRLYDLERAAGGSSFEGSVEQALQAVLMAPQFLYRPQVTRGSEEPYPLQGDELADRLAFFLWGTIPDDDLLQASQSGDLDESDRLVAQAQRMLADKRSRALATDFAAQWLVFADFANHAVPDAEEFPQWTPELAQAMYDESVAFFAHLFREDRPITDALFADYAFLNERLADHYGIRGVDGDQLQEVAVDGEQRGGVFGMGSVLTKMSMPLRTSPVNRGNWIVQAVLGYDLPEPPPDVPMLSDEPVSDDGLTIREQLAKHREDPACLGCHQRIDPPGIALETFDPIGRWRDQNAAGDPIDATGEMADGTAAKGFAGLREWFRRPENTQRFLTQFSRKLAAYGLGRDLLITDRGLIENMVAALESGEHRPSAAVEVLVTSQQFRTRRDAGEPLSMHANPERNQP